MARSKELHIARGLSLPLEAASLTLAIMGIRDSGKTNTAVVYVEELLDAGQQVVVIDPTDVWYGLKSSKDGKSAGYPVVILGGKKGDLPLLQGDGKTIADFIVDNAGVSVVISTRHFESQSAERRFVTELLNRLYFRKGQQETPTPVTMIFDEASRLVPQMVKGDAAFCVGAVQQIVRQGRSSGFGVVLIDQRPATVNKDVLAMLEMLVMHRVTSPQDRKALTAWIEQHDSGDHEAEFLDSLASLGRGDAWIWSPGLLDLFKRVHIRERRTFDSSFTPKIGEKRIAPKAFAQIDLDALKAKLSSTVEKARADDPRELRNQIAKLQHELRGKDREKAKADPGAMAALKADLKTEYDRGYGEAVASTRAIYANALVTLVKQAARMRETLAQALSAGEIVDGEIGRLLDMTQKALENGAVVATRIAKIKADHLDTFADTKGTKLNHHTQARGSWTKRGAAEALQKPHRASVAATAIGRTPQLMLNSMLFCEDLGVSDVETPTIRALCGIAKQTSLDTYLTRLRGWGLIENGPGGTVRFTDAGRSRAQPEGLPTTLDELHDKILGQLGKSEAVILRELLSRYPNPVDRETLKQKTGSQFTDTSFDTYIGRLRVPGFITTNSGAIRAAEFLFPAGYR